MLRVIASGGAFSQSLTSREFTFLWTISLQQGLGMNLQAWGKEECRAGKLVESMLAAQFSCL